MLINPIKRFLISIPCLHIKKHGQKIIYSFQRWNRNFQGIAVIQGADGHFLKDQYGAFIMVEQLARAGSNLPYFITDGNTPQGIFSITGTEISHGLFIGPTPNLQLLMPFEADSAFWHSEVDATLDPITRYKNLLPDAWKNYAPMTESFEAGKIGRTEILAHGTAIDPTYFTSMPYYPLTPTQGCLCAKEIWNRQTGKLDISDQFELVNAFVSNPPSKGYLMVINLDQQQKRVSKEEIKKYWSIMSAPVSNSNSIIGLKSILTKISVDVKISADQMILEFDPQT